VIQRLIMFNKPSAPRSGVRDAFQHNSTVSWR
jgi:hypothetical protein